MSSAATVTNSPTASDPAAAAGGSRTGVALALGTYTAWGLFPLFFVLLTSVGPVETVAHRVVWSLVFCLSLVALGGSRMGGGFGALRRLSARQVAGLALAAALLSLNWGVFIYGVATEQVVQVSLGYFTNPLVSVLLGVVLLGERLGRLQWVAIGIGAAAVVVLTVEDGRVPWIALSLAGSFGVYGLLKNRVGRGVEALPGMTVETAVLAPIALAYLVWLAARGEAAFGSTPAITLLLLATGPLTAIVLMTFAAASRRVRLSTMGMVQYVTPVLQLIVGVAVLGERMSPARVWGFALIWLALIILTAASLRRLRSTSLSTTSPKGFTPGSRDVP